MQEALSPNERDELRAQSALLALVLSNHPSILSAEELEHRFSGDADAFDVALWTLTAAGLLRREGASVLPTAATLHFDRLEP